MRIEIRLFGVFRMGRFEREVREYPAGSTVADVVRDLGLADQLLGIVVINDRHATVEHQLRDGDCLTLLPLLDGG